VQGNSGSGGFTEAGVRLSRDAIVAGREGMVGRETGAGTTSPVGTAG
jgi:hypothetical protein